MVRIKPSIDGKGLKPGFYDGPPPTPGTYRGIVKKMGLAKIAGGDNAGEDRIALLLEITEGKFKGAAVMHSLNLTTQGGGFVNQFLHALTDGSEKQTAGLEKWFWDLGYDVEPEPDGKMGQQFINIGKNFKPIGKPVAFLTKMDEYKGEPKAAIERFVVPVVGGGATESEPDDSPLENVVAEEDSVVDAEIVEEDSVPSESDDDDPWS